MSYLAALETSIQLLHKYPQPNEHPSPEDAQVIRVAINTLSQRSSGNFSEDDEGITEILRRLRGLLSGIRQIPNEILTVILALVLVGETYRFPGLTDKHGVRNHAPGVRLERVCRLWRQILICNLTPHIQVDELDRFAWRDACRLLEREGASDTRKDLRITINGYPGQPRSRTLHGLIEPYAPRLVNLALSSSLRNLLAFLSLSPGTLPVLRVLRLLCFGARHDPEEREIQPLDILAPKLEEFVFEHAGTGPCCCREWGLALKLKPCGVRRLSLPIADERRDVVRLVKVLKESTSLASCIVRTYPRTSPFLNPIPSSNDERAVMLSLGQLSLAFASTGEVSFFLSRISCPSLWELRWSYSYRHSAAMEFFNSCKPNLTILDMRHVRLASLQLRELLVGRKTLEKLVLDSVTGLDTGALDGLEGDEILPSLQRFKWLNVDDEMIQTIANFITARCPGSPGRHGCRTLGHVTLGIMRRAADSVLSEFRRTKDGWRELGVRVSFSGPMSQIYTTPWVSRGHSN
ncbi:hypothetical protein C8R46DRAFT_1351125 [Mycena filopes]|nr:hypothetical protein C8R46DRAFT_1351125 [Mycena filopes]